MKHAEAEYLLGGYATGTLTEAERQALFAAALAHQAIFDALMDEEALRELLADPAAKAQLLAALASPASARVVPFWRRPGLLGAAAGLIVAATAGLAYLHSPEVPPSLERREKVMEAPASAPLPAAEAPAKAPLRSPVVSSPKDVPTRQIKEEAMAPRQDRIRELPAASQGLAPAPSPAATRDASAERARSDELRFEAAGNLAKAAEAKKKVAEPASRPAGVPGGVPGGVIGGAVGGVVGGGRSGTSALAPVPASAPRDKAAAAMEVVADSPVPSWNLEPQADGSTRVRISAAAHAHPVLLWRKAGGVEVVKLAVSLRRGGLTDWIGQVRVRAGESLDLYLLNTPVADPAQLPETGPVDGLRARIHPAAKKESPR